MAYAKNKDADQPAHPHSPISIFIIRSIDRTIPKDSIDPKFQDSS